MAKCVNDMLASPSTQEKAKIGRKRVLSNFTYEHNALDYERIFKRAILKNESKP